MQFIKSVAFSFGRKNMTHKNIKMTLEEISSPMRIIAALLPFLISVIRMTQTYIPSLTSTIRYENSVTSCIRHKWEIYATFEMRLHLALPQFRCFRKKIWKTNFHISFTPSLISPTGTCEYLVLLWLCRKAYASYYLLACQFLRKPASFISFFLLGNVAGRVLPKLVSTNILDLI